MAHIVPSSSMSLWHAVLAHGLHERLGKPSSVIFQPAQPAQTPGKMAAEPAAAAPESRDGDGMFMVLAELCTCWGMLTLGWWPRSQLSETLLVDELLEALVEPGVVGMAAAVTEAPLPMADGIVALQSAIEPPGFVISNMAGSALARISRSYRAI